MIINKAAILVILASGLCLFASIPAVGSEAPPTPEPEQYPYVDALLTGANITGVILNVINIGERKSEVVAGFVGLAAGTASMYYAQGGTAINKTMLRAGGLVSIFSSVISIAVAVKIDRQVQISDDTTLSLLPINNMGSYGVVTGLEVVLRYR
jgi:hypothetical protein